MLKSRTKRLLVVATALVAASGLGVLVPGSAQAATPVCQGFVVSLTSGSVEYHTPTSLSGNPSCSLIQGNTGWGVVVLQESLRACFGQNIAVDGDFGPNTKNALMNAQRRINSWSAGVGVSANLSVDGEYGPHTASWWWDAQYWISGGLTNAGWRTCVFSFGNF
jgi:hypothetical protein